MDLHLYDNIPLFLKRRPNWVAWGIRDAPLKAPFDPSSLLIGRLSAAKAGVRETWNTYESAVECVRRGLVQGIGYEFDGDGGLYGVDLDHVISEDGELSPEAAEIVGKLNTYAEVSPSGSGLHLFVFAPGANITRHRKQDGFVEIISSRRNTRPKEEHGSAKWGEAAAVNRKYADRHFTENKILTQNVRIGFDAHKHRRNLNVLICGGSGAGKTRFYAKPSAPVRAAI